MGAGVMQQFAVWHRRGGERDLMVMHTDRYDYLYGFNRFIKTLKD